MLTLRCHLEAFYQAGEFRHIVCIVAQEACNQVGDFTPVVPENCAETCRTGIAPRGPIEIELEESRRRRRPRSWAAGLPVNGFPLSLYDCRQVPSVENAFLLRFALHIILKPGGTENRFLNASGHPFPSSSWGGRSGMEDSLISLFPNCPEDEAWE